MTLIEELTGLRNHIEEIMARLSKEAGRQTSGTPLIYMEWSVRAYNCLTNAGIRTIEELQSKRAEELLKLRNFGMTSLKETRKKLAERGLSLYGEVIEKETLK